MEEELDMQSLPSRDVLLYKLEERRELINRFYKDIVQLLPRLQRYVEDVHYAMAIGLNSSVVSHLTYNLLLTLTESTKQMNIYTYTKSKYLLDDEYDIAYSNWKTFYDEANEIKELISSIDDSFFDEKVDEWDIINGVIPPNLNNMDLESWGIDVNNTSLENIELDGATLLGYLSIASSIGASLLKCLRCKLNNTAAWLEDLKNGNYLDEGEEEDYDLIYTLNYNLYKEKYWPLEGRQFRAHIENHIPHYDQLTPEYLATIEWKEKEHFEQTHTGELWRDYFGDKKDLYFEAKRIKLDEEQWKYFFKQVCRFEEYDRWIDELNHPQAVTDDYPDSKWDKIFMDTIDVNKVKKVIPHLLPGNSSITNWFVLYKVLEEIDWLQDKAATHFISWVEDVYGWKNKTRHFKQINPSLKNTHSIDWDIQTMTSASIVKEYISLADKIRKEFVKMMDGKKIINDNTYYFKKPDLYIRHRSWR